MDMTDLTLSGTPESPESPTQTYEAPNDSPSPRTRGGLSSQLANVKVRTRLLALAGVLGLIWALVVIFSLTGIGSAKSHYTKANKGVSQLVDFHESYEAWFEANTVSSIASELYLMHAPASNPVLKDVLPLIVPEEKAAAADLSKVLQYPTSPAMLARIKQIRPLLSQYDALTAQNLQASRSGSDAAAQRAIGAQSAVGKGLADDFGALTPIVLANLNANGNKIGSTLDSLRTTIIVLTIVSLLFGAFVILLIIRSIAGPLDKLQGAAKRFARGNVEIDLDVHGRDEIATVADSFREAISAQKQVAADMVEFSKGHIGVPFEPRSDEDVLGHAFLEMQDRMREALGDHSTTRQLESSMGELLGTLQHLEHGLASMSDGDLTIAVDSDLKPITARAEGESVGFVADSYNEMITSAQASLDGYNTMREALREKLGDHSSLEALTERLEQLSTIDLAELQGALQAMNDGDLTIGVTSATSEIASRAGENIGVLARTFNSMLANTQGSIGSYNDMRSKISTMLGEISQSSESLSSASTEMASTSEEAGRAIAEIAHAVGSVAQGAEQQVRSVDDVKRITDELASASRLSAEAADETAAAADEARSLAREGVSAADDASQAMKAVRDSSEGATEAIRSLGEKSDQIGGIVATITGIAAQTNLLALNAAIEAARAGEHGRGFAVVAEEVRHLAEESQEAAATIGGLIEQIQQETAKAVEVVERGAGQTKDGVQTVEQARDAFIQIGQSVEDMSSRIEQIAASIRQIAASGDEMRESMNSVAAVAESSSASTEQVSASTEQTSASTQQIAASAQQLANTAEELEKLVGQFVLS
jgi:methyl-accepting chemotaxis protein